MMPIKLDTLSAVAVSAVGTVGDASVTCGLHIHECHIFMMSLFQLPTCEE